MWGPYCWPPAYLGRLSLVVRRDDGPEFRQRLWEEDEEGTDILRAVESALIRPDRQ